MNRQNFYDAPQRALGFLIAQAALIEPTVYRTQYQEIQYPFLVPVDTSAPEWIKTITYFSMDAVGQARWFSGKAMDVPHTELLREKFESTVSMASIGYRYDLEELNTAQLYGLNLNADKAVAARRISEEFIEGVAMVGDTLKNIKGLANSSTPTATTAPATGDENGGTDSTQWQHKTADQVLLDVNTMLAGVITDTKATGLADTLLLPYSVMLNIATRRIDQFNQTTLLQWIEQNNVLTRTQGRALTIRGVWGHLDTAGASTTKRAVFYRRSPDVLKMHIPMPFRFLPPWQVGPMIFEVPGIFRLGGIDIRLPKEVRYLDGI